MRKDLTPHPLLENSKKPRKIDPVRALKSPLSSGAINPKIGGTTRVKNDSGGRDEVITPSSLQIPTRAYSQL